MKKNLLKICTTLAMVLFTFMPISANYEGKETTSDPSTVVSKVMTYDEVVNDIATSNEISFFEAELIVNEGNLCSRMNARLATYRTISSQLSLAGGTYKPTVKLYVETSEGGGYAGIVRIANVSMDKEYNGVSRQFEGSIYVNLENANKIYFIVDGDFYYNGTSTYGQGVSIGIGESVTVSFTGSYTSNHFAYIYEDRTINWPY